MLGFRDDTRLRDLIPPVAGDGTQPVDAFAANGAPDRGDGTPSPGPLTPFSRRDLLTRGLRGGLLAAAAPLLGTSQRDRGERNTGALPASQGSPPILTLVTNRAPSDLDPHSAYDPGSGIALQGPFEGLIQLQPGTVDAYVPVLAETWTANADKSVWTFRLRPSVTFQDGTPLDAEAARASFERLLTLGLAPSTVLGRFITDPAQIAAPDPRTLVFDLGRPQPLFEAAMAAPYGTAVVNAAALRMHEVDGDWGHGWAQVNTEGSAPARTGYVLRRRGGRRPGALPRVLARVGGRAFRRHCDSRGDRAGDPAHVDRERRGRYRHDTALSHRSGSGGEPGAARRPSLHPGRQLPRDDGGGSAPLKRRPTGAVLGVSLRRGHRWPLEGFAKQAVGPVAELCRGFNPDTFVYHTDLARSRALLDRAGVAEGTVLSYALAVGNSEAAAIPELFQANLAQVGLQLDIQVLDFATYIGLVFGDEPAEARPNLFSLFWSPDYNDGWNQLWPQVACAAWQAGNAGQYCNARVDDLLEEAKRSADEARYLAALSEVQQIVTRDDPAAIYVAQAEWPTVLRRDLGGFDLNLVEPSIFDFYALRRESLASPGG